MRVRQMTLIWVILSLILIGTGFAQDRGEPRQVPGSQRSIADLEHQLRWNDQTGKSRYAAEGAKTTEELLARVDEFISARFLPRTARAEDVSAELDALLNPAKDYYTTCFALVADLPSGHFLIAGIEIPRGGPAVAEDAVSIRAYKNINGRFALVSSTSDLRSSSQVNPYLSDLHGLALPPPPVSGEFWFVAWARIPPQSPPTVALRLYGFDGVKFRTIWAPRDFLTNNVRTAVDLLAGGFIVKRAVDPSGIAPYSPSAIVHELYVPTPGGVQITRQWTTPIQ